ncbi:MAG: C25 family cysteine peptidase [candidate division WOR-3 bacterium]
MKSLPIKTAISLFLPLFLFASLSLIREDERGAEIVYENQLEKIFPGYPPEIAEGRKIDDYPLPTIEFFLGIPQEGRVFLSATGQKETFIKGDLAYDIEGNPIKKLPEKKALAEIKSIEYLRDIRFARVRLFPVQWLGSGFRVYNEIRVNVFYEKAPVIVEGKDYFDDIYEILFINGKKAKFYKSSNHLAREGSIFFERGLDWVKIKIDSTGIYQISGEELKKVGVNLTAINPKTLKIYHIGKFTTNYLYPDTMIELPIYVAGEEDGRFDEKDFILFYGEHLKSLYTNFNFYWLTWGIKEGKRMKRYSVKPLPNASHLTTGEDSCHLEFDLLCPARSGLLWLWQYFAKARGKEETYSLKFILHHAKTLKKIGVAFCGKSDSARLRFYLNEKLLDSFAFKRENPPTPSLFRKELQEVIGESVELKISLYGEKEQEVYLDYLDLLYEKNLLGEKKVNQLAMTIRERGNHNVSSTIVPKPSYLFEIISDTTTGVPDVKILEDFSLHGETLTFGKKFYYPCRFLITNEYGFRKCLSLELKRPQRLRRKSFAGDYFVITPNEFFKIGQLLAQYRQNNIIDLPRAKTVVATLSDIYDEYAFGIEEPGAIKKFLKEKRPYYVVLIGDATYDYRGLLPYRKYPGVPTYEYGYDFSPNPYTDKAYACDAWYADWDGEGGSPDIILSRLPGRNENEFRTFLEKIKNFERSKASYRQRFLLAGDDEFNGYYDRPDNIRFGTHIEQCEGLANLLGSEFEPVKIYLTEYPYPQPNDKPKARRALISALNEGVGMMAYFGHGWVGWLTHEKFLDLNSLSQLKNRDKPFFGFYGSCGVGKFDETEQECLAEELQRMEGGAIATVAATKGTISTTNYFFAQALFAPIIAQPAVPIGKGFLTAWFYDRKYHLFGDGATFIPLIRRTLPLSVSPCTLKPGSLITVNCDTTRMREGYYQITASAPKLYRFYRSHLCSLIYTLPGEIFFLGRGKLTSEGINAKFLFPKLPYPEVRYVENGSYTILPNTAKIRVWTFAQDTGISYLRDNLYFLNQEFISPDSFGPELRLYIKGKEIGETALVEREFILHGKIYDESGIALLKDYPLGFYFNGGEDFHDLRERIQFEFSSYQNANFSYPLRIAEPCSLTFILYDNLGNETKKVYKLNPIAETSLIIRNNLYLQNKGSGYFTFYLSLPASLTIRIYTISGRFLKEIRTVGRLGFNRVYFDGLDRFGRRLPKGLYLYQIGAQTFDQKKAKLLDKFLIP